MMMTLWKLVEDRAARSSKERWSRRRSDVIVPVRRITAPAASTGPPASVLLQLGPDRVRVSAAFGGRISPNQRSDSPRWWPVHYADWRIMPRRRREPLK